MDMVLYSLVKNKIANKDKGESNNVDNVGGIEIRFIELKDIAIATEQNTLYFVLGDYQDKKVYKDGDKINVGGKGVQCIIYNNEYIDYGVLNGNQFFSGYDYNRGYKREFRTSGNNGTYIKVTDTVADTINYMMIEGQTKLDGSGQTVGGDSRLNSIMVYKDVESQEEDGAYNITFPNGLYFNALPNGMADTLDVTTGVYTRVLETNVINGNLKWQDNALYGNYREFRCIGYENNKPDFLTYDGTYDTDICMPIIEDNAFTFGNTPFIVASRTTADNKECIYVYKGVLYVRILQSRLTGNTASARVSSFKKYLASNPINFSVGRVVPKQETILEVVRHKPIKAIEGGTTIGMNCDTSFPILKVELPVYINPPAPITSFNLEQKQEDIEQTEETVEEQPMLMSMRRAVVEETVDNYETIVIDGNFNWQNSAPLGDYREFKCIGFDEQPIFLTEDGYYNEDVFMPFNIDNVAIVDEDSDFIITTEEEAEGECIFVNNGVLYIHVSASDVQTGGGTTYAKSFKQYLTDNPITLIVKKC